MKKIGFNESQYKYIKTKEDSLVSDYNKLIQIAKDALASDDIGDHIEYLKDPYKHLVNVFFERFKSDKDPDHLDKELFISSRVKVVPSVMRTLQRSIQTFVGNLGGYAPTFKKDGLGLKADKKNFNFYLDPEKEGEYNALVKLVEAAKELKENHTSGQYICSPINIMNYHPGLYRDLETNTLGIRVQNYAKK